MAVDGVVRHSKVDFDVELVCLFSLDENTQLTNDVGRWTIVTDWIFQLSVCLLICVLCC